MNLLIEFIEFVMGFIEKVEKLNYIHKLIDSGKSGSADEMAKKVGVCRRSVLNYIDLLRELGAEITYNHQLRSYKYIKKSDNDILDL